LLFLERLIEADPAVYEETVQLIEGKLGLR
jgi:hypothetical protein